MYHVNYGSRSAGFHPVRRSPVIHDNQSLIKEYLDWKASYTLVAGRHYAIWVRRFQELTNKAPEAMTKGDWIAYSLSLKGRFAPKCVEFALNIAHNYLRFWHEQGRLGFPLYFAKVKAARSRSHNAATEDEYRRILKALKLRGNLRDIVIVMMLHDTGVRVNELARMEIEQLEENASAIIDTEKSVRRRWIFWNQDTDEVLHRYLAERINEGPDTDWLFAGRTGSKGHLTSRSIQRIVDQAWKEAAIERRITPHSFRHAFVHRLGALGVAESIIARLLGHATTHTVKTYMNLSRSESEGFARLQFETPRAQLRESALAA